MLPWQKAKQWHDKHNGTLAFAELIGWHLSAGVVYSAPDAFMLAREVRWDGQEAHDEGERNAWLVELAAAADGANAFGRFMRVAPQPQPWVVWHRRNEHRCRVFAWDKLTKKLKGN